MFAALAVPFVCFYVQLVAWLFLSISMILDLKVRAWFRVRGLGLGLENQGRQSQVIVVFGLFGLAHEHHPPSSIQGATQMRALTEMVGLTEMRAL